jgi:hypothetical protein
LCKLFFFFLQTSNLPHSNCLQTSFFLLFQAINFLVSTVFISFIQIRVPSSSNGFSGASQGILYRYSFSVLIRQPPGNEF